MTSATLSDLLANARSHEWDQATAVFEALCQEHMERASEGLLTEALLSQVVATCPEWAVSALGSCFSLLPEVENALDTAFQSMLAMVSNRNDVKGLYCEYFYDGGDGSSLDLFLCRSFDRNDDNWASDFGRSDVIEGPSIQALLRFDPEIELDPCARFIADSYCHAVLLAMLARIIARHGSCGLPVGFAQHDFSITYMRLNQ